MQIILDNLAEAINAIHAAPPQVVIEFAGAGSQALAWLHGVGGSSRTILEAHDRYAPASVSDAIGFEPEQFTSARVARVMATKAYLRACRLAGPTRPVAGIGCTAAIATDRTKRGAHRAYVAACDAEGVATYALTLAKGSRTRLEEENLVSLVILKAVAKICGVSGLPRLQLAADEALTENFEASGLLARLLAGDFGWLAVSPESHMTPGDRWPHVAFLSGAFNPLHHGHRQLARAAAETLQQEVHFELPLLNADKGPLELAEARRRIAQFAGWATVILTRAPLFGQKAQLFPHSVFVLGIDTVERLAQPRFYDDNPARMLASFDTIRTAGCRFLVAGREQDGHFQTLQDVALPEGYRDLFQQLPEDSFRADISSTTIRQNQNP